jgi:adenosylcobyric acid synthase
LSNISIFGTSSDAGKSTITFVIGKILQEFGYSVAPFKAQNVSNNSSVADDLSEIAIAQAFQAQVLEVKTSYHLNPILLKSGSRGASLIVNGEAVGDRNVLEYYRDLDSLKPAVKSAFEKLDREYDIIVAEGAGSPVELNLMDKDLSNIFIAREFNTKIILVADIEKGGVFASIYGVYHLLPEELKKNVVGVIVNKFRGDKSLFDEGIRIIEKEFKIPVLAVLPYKALNLGFEDSQSLKSFNQNLNSAKLSYGVINYPYMSNYNDFEPLIADNNIALEFIDKNISLERFDRVILSGSKLVIEDLRWLKRVGLFEQLESFKGEIFGICGGYQMMFREIVDKFGVETERPTREDGLGFIDDTIYFQKEKILKKYGDRFEIHHGVSKKYPLEFSRDNIYGTFSHGVFIDEKFRAYREKTLNEFICQMKSNIDIERLRSLLGL